jgi:hypothetical protein
MNITQVDGRGRDSVLRRPALLASAGLAFVGLALLAHALLNGARLELLLAALGFGAGAALVGLLAVSPGSHLVIHQDD